MFTQHQEREIVSFSSNVLLEETKKDTVVSGATSAEPPTPSGPDLYTTGPRVSVTGTLSKLLFGRIIWLR